MKGDLKCLAYSATRSRGVWWCGAGGAVLLYSTVAA